MLSGSPPINTASKGTTSRLKEARLQSVVQKRYRKVAIGIITCGGYETYAAKEPDLGIEIVHGCFTKRGNSILSVFGGKLLRVKLQNK